MASFLKPHLYISTSNRSGYKTTLAEPNCTWRFSVLDIGWASGDSGFINVLNLLQYNPFIRIKRGVHVRSRRGPLLSPLLSIILFYLDSQGNLVLNFVNTKRIFTIFFFNLEFCATEFRPWKDCILYGVRISISCSLSLVLKLSIISVVTSSYHFYGSCVQTFSYGLFVGLASTWVTCYTIPFNYSNLFFWSDIYWTVTNKTHIKLKHYVPSFLISFTSPQKKKIYLVITYFQLKISFG